MPATPSSASARQTSCATGSPPSAKARTRSSGQTCSRALARLSCIIRWSEERANSIGSGLGQLGFARHAEAALGDDVLLNLGGSAADDQAEVEHVALLPGALRPKVGTVPVEDADLAQGVDRQRRQLVVDL